MSRKYIFITHGGIDLVTLIAGVGDHKAGCSGVTSIMVMKGPAGGLGRLLSASLDWLELKSDWQNQEEL